MWVNSSIVTVFRYGAVAMIFLCVQGIVWHWQQCETAVGVKFVKTVHDSPFKSSVSISHISRDVQCVTWMKHLWLDNWCLIRIQELEIYYFGKGYIPGNFALNTPLGLENEKQVTDCYSLCFSWCNT